MLNLTLSEIATICQGHLIGADEIIHNVSIDSRCVDKNSLFVAIKGEHVDGHDYVVAAKNNGAKAALVQHQQHSDLPQIIIQEPVQALARLAHAIRQRFHGTVIAITGSSGKTTTRSMLTTILQQQGKTSATLGNFNNDLGVPLTLLAADLDAKFWVIEMGAAQQGDIGRLVAIAAPTISVITNIGNAHIGRFGSEQAIAEAKAEIYSQLSANDKAIVNQDDSYAKTWLAQLHCQVLTYSSQRSDSTVFASDIKTFANASEFILHAGLQSTVISLPLAGLHNVQNALCAATCALAAGAELSAIKQGLAQCSAVNGRLQPKALVHGGRLIDDSYNANPASVKAAIDTLSLQQGERILVLGDMAELGENSANYHAQLGQYAKQKGIDALYCVGNFCTHSAVAFGAQAQHFQQQQSLVDALLPALSTDSVVLVKGSRSSAMDVIVKLLEQKAEKPCC